MRLSTLRGYLGGKLAQILEGGGAYVYKTRLTGFVLSISMDE